ncbi:11588_t:CDS:2 [Gigaspora margarita]|uniref:11588_t:CDS:1 n=1 Tax=Gigaspora margarita TaxID=4874 RepID=A0ABN7V4S9_GIGMA|nr:11588_t:CDS:2 [Gigaspora margarita]
MSLFNIETDFHNSFGNNFHYGLQDLQPQNPFNNQDNEESVVSEIINGANDKNSHEISHGKDNESEHARI